MYGIKHTLLVLFIASLVASPIYAEQIHKWIDEEGVTHYSDSAPESKTEDVSVIETLDEYTVPQNLDEDYYSITNQWLRMNEERLAREKLKLEQEKQRAASQPPPPQVIYVQEDVGYGVSYPYYFPYPRPKPPHIRPPQRPSGGGTALKPR